MTDSKLFPKSLDFTNPPSIFRSFQIWLKLKFYMRATYIWTGLGSNLRHDLSKLTYFRAFHVFPAFQNFLNICMENNFDLPTPMAGLEPGFLETMLYRFYPLEHMAN